MPDGPRKRPLDLNRLAKSLVDDATGEAPAEAPETGKDPAAVALGRRGGLEGGKVRAERMTAEERSAAARRAVQARWSRDQQTE